MRKSEGVWKPSTETICMESIDGSREYAPGELMKAEICVDCMESHWDMSQQKWIQTVLLRSLMLSGRQGDGGQKEHCSWGIFCLLFAFKTGEIWTSLNVKISERERDSASKKWEKKSVMMNSPWKCERVKTSSTGFILWASHSSCLQLHLPSLVQRKERTGLSVL